jgi:hypothetical protein
MKKAFVAGLVVLAASVFGTAAHAREVYGSIGTEGLGVGYSQPIGTYSNVRADINGISIGHNFTAGDVNYDGTLKLVHAGIYADFFPAPSVIPFRFTAGVLIGDDELNATASSMSGSYTFNGVTVPANGQQVRATAKFPAVRPYVGIGFGHTPKAKKGFSAFFDAGVAFGKPHLTYDVPADIVAAAGQDNVNAEEQNLQNKVDKVRFYPIVKVGVTYRF